MRIVSRGRELITGGAAAALLCIGAGIASADGPRPYVIGATDLQGQTDWTGFYIGGKLGGAWSDIGWTQDVNVFTAAGAVPPGAEVSFGPSGFGGGIIGGGNLQVGHWIFGAELSYSGIDLSESATSPFFPATDTFTTKIDWIATVEGRIGYSWSHYLLYGKFGWAGSNASLTLVNSANGVTASSDEFVDGYTAGGGLEFITLSNVVLGVEYSYIDLDLSSAPSCPLCLAGIGAGSAPSAFGGSATINSVMVRASYLLFPED